MGFLASVGMLAIIFLIIYLGLKYASNKDDKSINTKHVDSNIAEDRDNWYEQQLIKHTKSRYYEKYGDLPEKFDYRILYNFSDKCREIEDEFSKDRKTSNITVSRGPYEKRMKKALSDPFEFWSSMHNYLVR